MKKKSLFFKKIIINALIILPLYLIMFSYTQGYYPSNLTLNPQQKLEKVLEGKAFTLGFSNEEFQIYYSKSEDEGDELESYSFTKKVGLWILEKDSINSMRGITYGKNNAYYYGEFAQGDIYDFIEDPQGQRIYGDKIQAFGMDTSLFQIPYKLGKSITYKFGDDENEINEQDLFLEGEVVFFKDIDGEYIEIISSIKEIKEEQKPIWNLIEETVESVDKSKKIPDGRTYSGDEESYISRGGIYVHYKTGDYISISRDKRFMDWSRNVDYDIELEGQHSNTIYISISDYSDLDSPLGIDKELDVYRVVVPKSLVEYYEKMMLLKTDQ